MTTSSHHAAALAHARALGLDTSHPTWWSAQRHCRLWPQYRASIISAQAAGFVPFNPTGDLDHEAIGWRCLETGWVWDPRKGDRIMKLTKRQVVSAKALLEKHRARCDAIMAARP